MVRAQNYDVKTSGAAKNTQTSLPRRRRTISGASGRRSRPRAEPGDPRPSHPATAPRQDQSEKRRAQCVTPSHCEIKTTGKLAPQTGIMKKSCKIITRGAKSFVSSGGGCTTCKRLRRAPTAPAARARPEERHQAPQLAPRRRCRRPQQKHQLR